MNKVDAYLKYLDFKSRVKKRIPYTFSLLRYLKWKIYKPFYIFVWSLNRRLVCQLKDKKLIPYSDNDKHLKSLKNKYKGKTAFIIGNGPSLRAEDLDILRKKGIYTFASNRINLIYDKTDWRPDCYIAIDRFIFRNNDQTIYKQLQENLELYFLSQEVFAGIKGANANHNICFFKSQPNSYYRCVKEFSCDVFKYVVDGFTVTYSAMQLAYYMGFKTVYLLGVDCNYAKIVRKNGTIADGCKEVSYFSKNYDPNNANTGYVDGMIQAYEMAEKFSKGKDFKIYNVSRGGVLEIFEREDIDAVFMDI